MTDDQILLENPETGEPVAMISRGDLIRNLGSATMLAVAKAADNAQAVRAALTERREELADAGIWTDVLEEALVRAASTVMAPLFVLGRDAGIDVPRLLDFLDPDDDEPVTLHPIPTERT